MTTMTRSAFIRATLGGLAASLAGTPHTSAQEPSCATPVPPAVQSFSGDGPVVTAPFTLPVGIYIVRAIQQGSGNFGARLVNRSGDRSEVVYGKGDEEITHVHEVEEEEPTILEVVFVDGPWTIDFVPAFPEDA
jgi:hypothetical protein